MVFVHPENNTLRKSIIPVVYMKFIAVVPGYSIISYNPDVSFPALKNLVTFRTWKPLINREILERRLLWENTKSNNNQWYK
jgi:hypothetical protein